MASRHYRPLVESLASHFTVYLIERRGRGESGPQGDTYSLSKEADDLIVMLQKHRIELVLAHSYGGLIALQAALRHPISRLALYEPAITLEKTAPGKWLDLFESQLGIKNTASAFAHLARGMDSLGPAAKLPDTALLPIAKLLLRTNYWKERIPLLATIPNEERENLLNYGVGPYSDLRTPTLLIAGGNTTKFFKDAAVHRGNAMPNARLTTIPGLDHTTPETGKSRHIARNATPFLLRNEY